MSSVISKGFYPMQALKALVIFMAVLIVAGMGLLVYGLITRTGGDEDAAGSAGGAWTEAKTAVAGLVEAHRYGDALALIDVRVLDHIVTGGPDSISFAERGLI